MTPLVATAWTSAVPIDERVAAVAEAGYRGMGLVADDLVAIRDTIGFDGLRQLLADQAADHGTTIAIETMPFSIITTVPMGAELVTAAAHPGVGLLIDA
ncbi:hypothetical protein [Mycolicibacterium sphagni]|uniref:Uncharacterized protein n=1 Tax=Mycolicibacterium sphagni TaxID=1786 RepID=A0ABX2JZV2_9MYCO|nr:hypothetical protein [Mycolicibacterium sphagni]NTY63221.1 hypothetical protein [Mycolicibacterium sphagni]